MLSHQRRRAKPDARSKYCAVTFARLGMQKCLFDRQLKDCFVVLAQLSKVS